MIAKWIMDASKGHKMLWNWEAVKEYLVCFWFLFLSFILVCNSPRLHSLHKAERKWSQGIAENDKIWSGWQTLSDKMALWETRELAQLHGDWLSLKGLIEFYSRPFWKEHTEGKCHGRKFEARWPSLMINDCLGNVIVLSSWPDLMYCSFMPRSRSILITH